MDDSDLEHSPEQLVADLFGAGADESVELEAVLGSAGPRTVGGPRNTFYVAYERDLVAADHEALSAAKGYVPQTLARLRASHHSLARCLAAGMSHAQASLVTGYAPTTVGQLCCDPAFKALMEDYRQESKGVFADLAVRMADLSLDAIEELQERLHREPEKMSVPILLDIVKSFADRTGHGPNQEVHLKVENADTIDRPPRESYDEWRERRKRELMPSGSPATDTLSATDKVPEGNALPHSDGPETLN